MKVCMVNDNFYRGSGAAIAIRRICEALEGVEYCAAGVGDRQPEDLSWIPAGQYAQFNLKTLNPVKLAWELLKFRAWFNRRGCDLVHSHHRRLAAILRLAGIPVLYTGQLAFPPDIWFRLFHPRQMTAITKSVAENILRGTGTDPLMVISNPVEFPGEPPSIEVQSVKNRAICVARLDPIKGHTHLLEAWKILHERGFEYHLDLVGEGVLRESLEAQSRRNGTEHLIHFRGFREDVLGAVKQSLFAILVSEGEGQGIVTLEAAAAGRASLLTAVPGSVDLLPPGRRLKNGLKFGDSEELASALEEWFRDPVDTVREGRTFFDFLKRSSDPQLIAQRYQEVYRMVLGRGAPALSDSVSIS